MHFDGVVVWIGTRGWLLTITCFLTIDRRCTAEQKERYDKEFSHRYPHLCFELVDMPGLKPRPANPYSSRHEHRDLVAGKEKNDQFSAECKPPEPARNSMLPCSPSGDWPQFHRHAPQWTHFSRSKSGVPSSPCVRAWPEH